LKFTKNPSSYLYEKIKTNVNDKFIDAMNKSSIYYLNENFNKKIGELSNNFISKIEETNEELFNIEYEKLKENHIKKVNATFVDLCKWNSNMISSIEKINSKNDFGSSTKRQISEKEHKNLNEIKYELFKFTKYGIKEKKEEQLIYYELPYDFTRIKDKKYNLKYMDKYVETDIDIHKGNMFIINDKNDDEFKNKFKIEIIEDDVGEEDDENDKKDKETKEKDLEKVKKEEEEDKGDDSIKGKDSELLIVKGEDKENRDIEVENLEGTILKEEERKDEKENLLDEKKKEKEDYKVEKFIDFKKAKKLVFSKFEIEKEENIKNSIEKDMKIPKEKDVKNPPEILLSKYNIKEFSNFIENLKKSSFSLYEILKEIKEKK